MKEPTHSRPPSLTQNSLLSWVAPFCALVLAIIAGEGMRLPGELDLVCPLCGAYAALLMMRSSRWAWTTLPAATLCAEIFSIRLLGISPEFAFAGGAKTIIEGMIVTLIAERIAGSRIRLARTREMMSLLGGAAVAGVVGAAVLWIETKTALITFPEGFNAPISNLACFLGVIALSPLIIGFDSGGFLRALNRRFFEIVLLLLALGVMSYLIFARTAPTASQPTYLYTLFPILIWAGFRFGTFGAAAGLALIISIAGASSGYELGPLFFNLDADIQIRVFHLQLFLLTLGISGLILGSLVQERRQTRIALAQSEEKFRLATLGTNDGLWDWDLETHRLVLSARASELLGYGAHEMRWDRTVTLDQVHPDDREGLQAAALAHLEKGTPYDHTLRLRTKDGNYRWVRSRGIAAPGRGRTHSRIVGSFADVTQEITRRKVLELIASGASLKRILEELALHLEGQLPGARAAFMVADPDDALMRVAAAPHLPELATAEGRRLPISPQMGCTGSAIYGNRRIIVEDTAKHPAWESYTDFLQRHGIRAAWAEPLRSDNGGCLGALAVYYTAPRVPTADELHAVEDIASLGAISISRARAAEELKERGKAFERVLRHVSGIAYRAGTEPDAPLKFARGGCRELTGYNQEELISRDDLPFSSLVHPEDRHLFTSKFLHFERSREQFSTEYRIVTRTGATKWVLDQSQCIVDSNGAVTGLEGLITDITARKTAEEGQQMLEGQLKQAHKMEAIGTLAGGIAHDFNNILGAILGFAELAKRKISDPAAATENIDQVTSAALRARNLVSQILTFSRKDTSDFVPLSLASVIDEVLSFLRATLPSTITIRASLDRKAPHVNANPTQIHQILINLAANAADSIGERGGAIELTLGQARVTVEHRERLPELAEGNYLVLTVQDTGSGIPAEVLPRIFDPFFTTKTVGKGTGLGLSVVHGIVRSHGGTVRVESSPGNGTTFTIYFPALASGVSEEESHELSLPINGQGERIMFVDDEQALVHLATEILTELNYSVQGFTSSRAAWDAFQRRPENYDLVITDRTMPGMTGVELSQRIKAIRPGMPIVIITGLLGEEATRLEQARERIAVLLKPYTTELLASTVRALLDGREIPTQAEEQIH